MIQERLTGVRLIYRLLLISSAPPRRTWFSLVTKDDAPNVECLKRGTWLATRRVHTTAKHDNKHVKIKVAVGSFFRLLLVLVWLLLFSELPIERISSGFVDSYSIILLSVRLWIV
jgi:hypothetical protein